MSHFEIASLHLGDDDDLESFRSGQPALDEWLRKSARQAESMRSGRTWAWTRGNDVVGYYTLAGHLIERDLLPVQLGRGSPDRIAAVLIARLALHEVLQGQGLGGALLADASRRIIAATDIVAARFVVVDAINEKAERFYLYHGFRSIPGGRRRLVRKVSDLVDDVRPR